MTKEDKKRRSARFWKWFLFLSLLNMAQLALYDTDNPFWLLFTAVLGYCLAFLVENSGRDKA